MHAVFSLKLSLSKFSSASAELVRWDSPDTFCSYSLMERTSQRQQSRRDVGNVELWIVTLTMFWWDLYHCLVLAILSNLCDGSLSVFQSFGMAFVSLCCLNQSLDERLDGIPNILEILKNKVLSCALRTLSTHNIYYYNYIYYAYIYIHTHLIRN